MSDDLSLQIKGISHDSGDRPAEAAPVTQLSPPYLRQQADRFQRLSRNCMDLTTARDLRLMAEEYFAEATVIEAKAERPGHTDPTPDF